jgi:hypothetical protein
MAAITFDTLQCTDRLVSSGMPERQARMQTQIMSEAFVHNVDALVTQDYLEKCFDAHEARMNTKFTLLFWMLGVGFSVLIIPQLQGWLG